MKRILLILSMVSCLCAYKVQGGLITGFGTGDFNLTDTSYTFQLQTENSYQFGGSDMSFLGGTLSSPVALSSSITELQLTGMLLSADDANFNLYLQDSEYNQLVFHGNWGSFSQLSTTQTITLTLIDTVGVWNGYVDAVAIVGGGVPPGTTVNFVLDGLGIVPEPATFVLVAFSLCLLAVCRIKLRNVRT